MNANETPWVVVGEYYQEENSIHQASGAYATHAAAQERADEMATYGHGNELEVRTLASCLRDGIE